MKGENCWRLQSQAEKRKRKEIYENDIIALLEDSFWFTFSWNKFRGDQTRLHSNYLIYQGSINSFQSSLNLRHHIEQSGNLPNFPPKVLHYVEKKPLFLLTFTAQSVSVRGKNVNFMAN